MIINRCKHSVVFKQEDINLDRLHGMHGAEESGHSKWRWKDYARRSRKTVCDLSISMEEVFALVEKEIPSIITSKGLMGGKPCIKGTRIPVYMILDAIEDGGTLNAAVESYPQLSMDTVKDAVRFSRLVMECPVDNKIEAAS